MAWNNNDLKSFFNKYGDRICAISLNNGKNLFIGYPGAANVKLSDISFETLGGCDVMVINHKNISYGKELTFKSYVTTEFIESISVMSEKDAEYRIDPLTL